MERKQFIHRLGFIGGIAILSPSIILQSCDYVPKERATISETDIALLNEIGETILPETDKSPGAKAAGIGNYMLIMYSDCMEPEEQEIFRTGLNMLDKKCAEKYNMGFIDLLQEEKIVLIQELNEEAITNALENESLEKKAPHYFHLLKDMTVTGYFTSEIGMTLARKYEPLPGRFIACMEYEKNQKPWAI